MNEPSVPKDADYRAKTAARKRARTRAHILDSILTLIGKKNPDEILIEDVLDTAGISRGTLYAHFSSVRQAIAVLATEMAASSSRSLDGQFGDLSDPVRRVALGSQLALWHAAMDINWGRAFAYCDGVASDTTFLAAVERDIVAGHKLGLFRQCSVQALIDVHVGAIVRGSRYLVEQTRGRAAYIRDVSTLMLLALGVSAQETENAISWAQKEIRVSAPAKVNWWKPLR
jgi:AcrR family transcriptional regulator